VKAVILAGGFGTRLSEETTVRPKPMVEIGGLPILWHIMKIYSAHDIDDFIICCGHKGEMIKQYFCEYATRRADITVDLAKNEIEMHSKCEESWRITLIDTGQNTMTGGRLRRVADYVGDETFCLTYGDGVADIDMTELISFHQTRDRICTLTAVRPPGRFGAFRLSADQDQIVAFKEKPEGEGAWVNGGFFVLEPAAIGYIESDLSIWEHEPLERLARDGQLSAFRHDGFWQPMDTLHDRMVLEQMWEADKAPWKVW
jgi:glucose-1-phosphate cytidylyltransferase